MKKFFSILLALIIAVIPVVSFAEAIKVTFRTESEKLQIADEIEMTIFYNKKPDFSIDVTVEKSGIALCSFSAVKKSDFLYITSDLMADKVIGLKSAEFEISPLTESENLISTEKFEKIVIAIQSLFARAEKTVNDDTIILKSEITPEELEAFLSSVTSGAMNAVKLVNRVTGNMTVTLVCDREMHPLSFAAYLPAETVSGFTAIETKMEFSTENLIHVDIELERNEGTRARYLSADLTMEGQEFVRVSAELMERYLIEGERHRVTVTQNGILYASLVAETIPGENSDSEFSTENAFYPDQMTDSEQDEFFTSLISTVTGKLIILGLRLVFIGR